MKILLRIFTPLLAISLIGCNQEDQEPKDLTYNVWDIVQKDGPTVRHRLEDGRVVESLVKAKDSDQYVGMATYVYNSAGLLTSIEGENYYEELSYNSNDQVAAANFFMNDELIRAMQFFYDEDGKLDHTIENLPNDTINQLISKYVYEGGNPVEESRYVRNMQSNTTSLMDVNYRKFDSNINPYHTIKLDYILPSENNVVEFYSSGSPDQKTLTEYTYNASGMPVSFIIRTNYDAWRVEGTYLYENINP